MKRLIVALLLLACCGNAMSAELKDIPEMPVEKISQRMAEILPEDVNLVYDTGKRNADAMAKLLNSLKPESFYEVALALYGLKNHGVTSDGKRVDYLAAQALDRMYGIDAATAANDQGINDEVLKWAKIDASLMMAVGHPRIPSYVDTLCTSRDFSYYSDRIPPGYSHAGYAWIFSFANPYDFPIKIQIPSFAAIKKATRVSPEKAAAKFMPPKNDAEKEFTVLVAPHTFYEHRMPLAWFVDSNYEGEFSLDMDTSLKERANLFYRISMLMHGEDGRELKINRDCPVKIAMRCGLDCRQKKTGKDNGEYVNICHTVMKYLETFPETTFARYFLADIPENIRKTYNPQAPEFADYKKKIVEGWKYRDKTIEMQYDDPNPCEESLYMEKPSQRDMDPIATLSLCNSIADPLHYIDTDNKILKAVTSFDRDSEDDDDNDGDSDDDNQDNNADASSDGDEEEGFAMNSPFAREFALKSHATYFRHYFNTKLSSSDTFFFLSAFDSWPLFDRSFYLFDRRVIEKGDLQLAQNPAITPIIDPMGYVGKPMCDFAAAITSLNLADSYPQPRSAEFFRKFYSLLDMHVCRKNLRDLGLAEVNAVWGKSGQSVRVEYVNHTRYLLELFFRHPWARGIRQARASGASAENGDWQVCGPDSANQPPERVAVKPGQKLRFTVAAESLLPGGVPTGGKLEIAVDLYARLLVPEMEMDFPEPFGTRIRKNIVLPAAAPAP